jgi:hypothetical protein
MTSATFDTLGYFEKLKNAGVSEQQAKVQTEALREIIEEKLATKQDIKDLRAEMREMEYRLTANIVKWVAGMLVAQAAVIAALVKLL